MIRLRPFLRRTAYRSGCLALIRKKRRKALTVVMFHRVVDPADPDFADADPGSTVPAPLFEEMLGFFREHYNAVGLADLLAAADRVRPLPEHALLISFDDGWADNLRYAAPLLNTYGLPAVVFVAAEPVLSPEETWWQQRVFDFARQGEGAALPDGSRISGMIAAAGDDGLEIVCRLGGLAETERSKILASLPERASAARMMLAPDELPRLIELGIAVGVHGYTHLPLTRVADLHQELTRARSAVASLSGDAASAAALACPHGCYDPRVLAVSREVGIRLVFTSDPILNRTDGGMITEELPLGRISMEAPHLADRSGRLDRSAAAAWLWRRPCAAPPSTRAAGHR